MNGKAYTIRESTTVLPGDMTKAELISRMNRLCLRAWTRVAENLAEFNQRTRNSGWSRQERLVRAIHTQILTGITFHIFDGFMVFGAPKGEEHVVEEITGPMRIAVERGERERIASVKEVVALFADYNQRAHRFGLDKCVVTEERLPSL